MIMDEESLSWKIFHSLWILISFLPFFGGLAFIWIGLRVNEQKWKIEGIIYLIPFFFMLIYNKDIETIILIPIFVWIFCIIRAFIVSGEYLRKLKEKNRAKAVKEVSNPININHNQANHLSFAEDSSNKITFNHNNQQQEINEINKIDFKDVKEEVDIPIINIEKATIKDLTKLPGITTTLAEEIISIRKRNKIYSVNDLKSIKLNPEQIDSLTRYVQFSEKAKHSNPRRLDI